MIETQMKYDLVSDNNDNIVVIMPIIYNAWIYKEWQVMLSIHVVSMTLRGPFTISIEQDK